MTPLIKAILTTTVLFLLVAAPATYINVYKPLQEHKALNKKYTSLHNEYTTIKELLETQKGETLDPEIVDWAYKNADNHIPKITIIQVLEEASKYDTYHLMIAVFKEESRFDPYARSKAGAKGLGQIRTKIPSTGKSVWVDEMIKLGIWEEEIDVYDYRKNIAATDHVLRTYRERYGSWRDALYHYVNGDDKYVTRVLANYAELSLLNDKQKPDKDEAILPEEINTVEGEKIIGIVESSN